MRYNGECFRVTPGYKVTDVTLAGSKVSIDWIWDGGSVHLKAKTDDGVSYLGCFGYPAPDPARRVAFKLFRCANGDLLFFGRWFNTADGGGEEWMFLLHPTTNTPDG